MMKMMMNRSVRFLALVGCVALLLSAAVTRPMLKAVEGSFNARLETLFPGELFAVLDTPQGVYVEGFGVVFTARVNLVEAPGLGPFRPALKSSELATIRDRKVQRLPVLRDSMRAAMVAAAGILDTVPGDEQVVYGVNLFHHPYEDSKGLPAQIVMSASRKQLLTFQTQNKDKAALVAAITVREF